MKALHWSLRTRVFLFFLFLALAAIALIAGGLWFGWSRAVPRPDATPIVLGGIAASFAVTGLVAWIWRLFDENLAHPLQALAAQLRVLAQGQGGQPLPAQEARYLGDLAPAAQAISDRLGETRSDLKAAVARETAQLGYERDRLGALLADASVGIIQANERHDIVFYNARARGFLSACCPPRLGQNLAQCLDAETLSRVFGRLARTGGDEESFECASADGAHRFDAVMRLLPAGPSDAAGGGYVLTLRGAASAALDMQEAGAVYDFGLMRTSRETALEDRPLAELAYVVFDTETTGLLPSKGDEIVQIAALRALGARRIPGERFETYVNPGMPIPEASTKIHGVTDRMVVDAPDIGLAGRELHSFATGAVLVAHNAPFDMAFLHKNRAAIGARFDNPVIDTVLMSALLFGITSKHTLDALCDRLGITIPPALRHTAMGDAHATMEAFSQMLGMAQDKGIGTFGQLEAGMAKQTRLYRNG